MLAILSHRRGAVHRPAGEAGVARLVEHPIGQTAIDVVTVGSLGTCLEGTTTEAVGLGEVQQEGGAVGTDHLGAVDQDLSHPLGVTQEGSEAGGGDEVHLSQGRGVVEVVPLACSYPTASGGGVEGLGTESGHLANWHTATAGGAGRL